MLSNLIKSLGAALFLASENIGLFLLTVPFALGVSGFYPSLITIALVWFFVLAIALLYLEATLSFPAGANLLSMVGSTYGKGVKWILCLLFFVLVSYPLQALYLGYIIPEAGKIFSSFGLDFSPFTLSIITSAVVGILIFLGLGVSIFFNFLLMISLFIALYFFANDAMPYISSDKLSEKNWIFLFFPVAILYAANGFQPLVPPIASFLKRNRKFLIATVLLGTLLPYLLFIFMSWVVLGSFPTDIYSLLREKSADFEDGISLLEKTEWAKNTISALSFFAISTYLLAINYVPLDILLDGFDVPLEKRKGKKRLLAVLAVLIPPIIIAVFLQNYLTALLGFMLDYGCLFLSFIPLFLVWRLRYKDHSPTPPLLFGGKKMLYILFIGLFYLIWIQGLISFH